MNPHRDGAYLSHAVYGFFLNGGGRCYVTNIVPGKNGKDGKNGHDLPALLVPTKASKAVTSLAIKPKEEQTQDIVVDVLAPSGDTPPDASFTLRITMGSEVETFENVNLGKKGAKPVAEALAASRIVTVVEEASSGPLADRVPEFASYTLAQAQTVLELKVQPADFAGDPIERTGMEGLQVAEDVTMLSCPDLMSARKMGLLDDFGVQTVQKAMIAHCEKMGDRMAIIDPPPDLNPQQMLAWRDQTNYDSKYAALYYPWLSIGGPDGEPLAVPPSGHMAGVYARSDNERGVHKAPANEIVRGAIGPVQQITKGEQDLMNPKGINCVRSFVGRGVRVWGARTLSSDPAWRYINVRRLFNFVEKSIEQGTQWVVFEPNDQDLWAKIRRDIGAFLTGLWREGMLFGATPGEAFFVKCDAELNPSDVRDRGQLFIDVGLAPVKPAEFVIFRLSQFAGGGA
jgi:phage tail sheath protein FI